MSQLVQINDSAGEARPDPIVLRLPQGEETDFEFKLVNLGDPTNVNIRPSVELSGAVRIRKANHYVVLEETIEGKARMPRGEELLEGEILVRSGEAVTEIPVTLISESRGNAAEEQEALVEREVDEEEEKEGEEDLSALFKTAPEPEGDEIPRIDAPIYEEYQYRRGRRALSLAGIEQWYALMIPAALLFALIILLVLTFYSRAVPEYPGALASSMLIVTLIIYGAATLLKA